MADFTEGSETRNEGVDMATTSTQDSARGPSIGVDVSFALRALLRLDLKHRGIVMTAVLEAFKTAEPTRDQIALRALFESEEGIANV